MEGSPSSDVAPVLEEWAEHVTIALIVRGRRRHRSRHVVEPLALPASATLDEPREDAGASGIRTRSSRCRSCCAVGIVIVNGIKRIRLQIA
jgi:hypothetical protein